MRDQSAKDPALEGAVSNIKTPKGEFCKDLHLVNRSPGGSSGDISPSDPADSSSPSSEGPTSEDTKTEGDFCKEQPLKNQISNADGPVTKNTKIVGGLCKELLLKVSIPKAGGISNAYSSTPFDDDVAGPSADIAAPSIFSSGFSSVIGRRSEMEDFVAVVPAFVSVSGDTYDFFAVYDGHGGGEVAQVCRDRMHEVVAEEAMGSPGGSLMGSEQWWRGVMERSFERVDAEMAGLSKSVGSTALVAVVGPRSIVVANCGDCRAVMSRDGETIVLSSDHKPDRLDEMRRVESSGGWIVDWHGRRVLGVLATSRSLGDYDLKPHVISKPELTVVDRTEEDEFLILASDGLWDVISNDVACKVVRNCVTGRTSKKYPEDVSEHSADMAATLLTNMALSRRSMDNVSVVVVQFTNLLEYALAEDAISPFSSSI